jgi:hypothetical protein
MKKQSAIRATCGALILLIAALVIWETISAHTMEAATAAAREAHLQLLERVANLRASIQRTSRVAANPGKTAAVEVPLKNVDTPEQLKQRLRVLHAWMALRYARLYRKAGFSPEQIQQFEALLEDHYLRTLDLAETTAAQGLSTKDPAIAQLVDDENARYSAARLAALGSQLVDAIRNYQRIVAVQQMTDAVAGSTYYTQPLGTDQADQLTQILANNSLSYANGKSAKGDDLNIGNALVQAQTVLSTEQLAALKNLSDGNQSWKAYQLAIAAATKPH